jgi:cysteine-rich repeat protein
MKMRSFAWFGAALLVVLASACGGDGGNNNGSCGDGHVTGSEQCDDGNTTSGDGCSASCTSESNGSCGDGTVQVATEQCDDGNTTAGDGCSATCQNEGSPLCGNGAIDGAEACDDHNTASNDGCSATCHVETGYTCTGTPSVCTMGGAATCTAPNTLTLTAMGTDLVGNGTGDTTTAMNNVPAGTCDTIMSGAGPDNIWKFTTTDTRDVIILLNDTTVFDGNIRLMTTACDLTTEVIDINGTDGCSDSGFAGDVEALGYMNLPAGTYYLSVDGYDAMEKGTYDFTVTASMPGCGNGSLGPLELCDDGNTATGDGCDATCAPETGWTCDQSEPSVCQMEGCGDGFLQMGEDCDDDNTAAGDGCDATCHIETGYSCAGEPSVCALIACGNGIIEGTEECDDGNTNSGDRCNSACVLEQDVTEAAEPNNTTPQILTAGSHIIRGEFSTDDVDLYTFTLATTSTVEIETYFTINGSAADYDGSGTNHLFDCPNSSDDTALALFPAAADPTMDAMALAIDVDDGDHFCAYLGSHDSDDDALETGVDPTQLVNLPAGTYTIRVTDDPLAGTIASRRYMLDLKITPMGTGPVVPAAGDIKINEFLAADGGATNGGVDSNCDGVLTNSDDEFIELVNVSNKTLDLTGLTISDALGVKFTFATQTTGSLTLAPGKAVVVWGGGTPMCAGVTNFFINGTAHTLSLNDNGDTITLATGGATPVTIATTTYLAADVMIGTSRNLSPDVTGTAYALHSAVTGHVGNFSPGKHANGTAF